MGESADADYRSDYFYDTVGRMSRITGPGLPAYGVVYSYVTDPASGAPRADLVGRIDFRTDASTTVASVVKSYEPQRDLIASVENLWGTSTVSKYAYQNDPLGRRTSILRTGTAFTTAPHFDLYGYNDRNELTGSTRYNGPDPANPAPADHDPARDFGYAYDAIGNRLTYTAAAAPPTGYTSNNVNQYTATTAPAESFLYDADGNLAIDASYVYTWDAENRLIGVGPASPPAIGDKKLAFAYDYRGRRARKQVFEWNGSAYTLIAERRFVYDGWNLLLELDGLAPGGTGVPPVIRAYTWGLDLSGQSGNATVSGLHAAGGIGGLLATHDTNGTPSIPTDDADYLHFHDANGNVGQLVDIATGALAAHYEYDPYGGAIVTTGPFAAANPFRFSTKYLDAEITYSNGPAGLYYYGYRYYSPRLGRWLSRDPLAEGDSLNELAFALNCPLFWIDPDGRLLVPAQPTSGPTSRRTIKPTTRPSRDRPIDETKDTRKYNCAGLAFRNYQYMGLAATKNRLKDCRRINCKQQCKCGELKCFLWELDVVVRRTCPVPDFGRVLSRHRDFHIVCGLVAKNYAEPTNVCTKMGGGPIGTKTGEGSDFLPLPTDIEWPNCVSVTFENMVETCYCCENK